MITLGTPLRARVLKVEGNQAVLGIYVDGQWHRISARIEGVHLEAKDWIKGQLCQGEGGTLYFKGTQKNES